MLGGLDEDGLVQVNFLCGSEADQSRALETRGYERC